MPESDFPELLRVIRPMLKGHIRQTRNLLAVLAQLETDLNALDLSNELTDIDQRMAQEAQRNGRNESLTRS